MTTTKTADVDGDPRPDLRAGRGRRRPGAVHLQRGGGRRGAGPDRPPLAGADHRRHPLPPRDGPGRPRGRGPGPAAQPGQPAQGARDQAGGRRGQGPGRAHPDRGQRRLPPPRPLQAVRRGHPRGPGRVGPDGAGLLRRGRLRRREDLGQGVVGAPDDRVVPAGLGDLRPSAAPRGDRGRPAAGRAARRAPPASPPCWPRASATPSGTR